MTGLSKVTEIFQTPYGKAIDQRILRVVCRVLEKDRILVQRKPLIELAEPLAEAYVDLLEWQEAFDLVERMLHPETYARGAVKTVPPRTLEDVLVFRATTEPVPVSPTAHLPPDQARILKRVRSEGPDFLNEMVPF